jgi:hypothetical protein
MANILDYLDWRGDITFDTDPFHPVDALILAQLSYLPCDGIVPKKYNESVTIADVAAEFDPEHVDEKQISFCFLQDQELLSKLAESERFKNIRLTGYVSRTSDEDASQFSAVTCILPDGRSFLSFRGTDGSIVGWKEDFNFSFKTETPGQHYAVEYINAYASQSQNDLLLGGHSKGGNFAVYAAVFCRQKYLSRIQRIYDFDGPGFRDEIADSEEYAAVIPKILSVIPQSSLVGQLLTSNTEHKIVMSKAAGVAQHLAYSWEILRHDFVYAEELSKFGMFINRTMTEWLDDMDDDTRQTLTDAIFDIIQASDQETFYEMQQHKLRSARAIIKAMRALEPEQQAVLKQAIAKLAAISKEVLFPEKTTDKKQKQIPQKSS